MLGVKFFKDFKKILLERISQSRVEEKTFLPGEFENFENKIIENELNDSSEQVVRR